MDMSGEIRVKTDRKYKNLYNDLKNYAFGDMHEIFFLCTCLAHKNNKRKPLEAGEDRFWSRTFTPEEYASFYAIMLESHDMDLNVLKEDKKVIEEMEALANAGMEILIEEFLEDYLVGDNKLEKGISRELPKTILHYIFENAEA